MLYLLVSENTYNGIKTEIFMLHCVCMDNCSEICIGGRIQMGSVYHSGHMGKLIYCYGAFARLQFLRLTLDLILDHHLI